MVAKFPSVATTFGRISSIWRKRWLSQAAISSGCGSRFPGGRHFKHVRDEDVVAGQADPGEELAEQLPGGADERHALLVLVEPGRLADEHQVGGRRARAEHDLRARRGSGQRVQPATASRSAASSAGSRSPGASRSAFNGRRSHSSRHSSRRRRRRRGRRGSAACWCREPRRPRTAASPSSARSRGTRGVSSPADELLEVRLAAHADVLVDRHRGLSVPALEGDI